MNLKFTVSTGFRFQNRLIELSMVIKRLQIFRYSEQRVGSIVQITVG